MRIYNYKNLTDDVVHSHNQNYKLSDNYQILPSSLGAKIWNPIIRTIVAGFAWLYSRLYLHVKVIGKEKIKNMHSGYFVYGNHTQILGDVVTPLTIFSPYRFYAIAGQANWGIPFIGKHLLPYGALPVGNDLKQNIKLVKTINTVINHAGIIMIYPEAHVWPYYTKIRPFPPTSFHFPVDLNAPSFTATSTYQYSTFLKKPKIVVYIDGPFYPDTHLSRKKAQAKLYKQIFTMLNHRSRLSTIEYYHYIKKQ